MKLLMLAALLGVAVLATAGPVLADGESPRPEGLPEGVVVTMPPDWDWR